MTEMLCPEPIPILERGYVDPRTLNFTASYQREVEESIINSLCLNMMKHGYDPAKIIVLNENNEVVDGTQRSHAAMKLFVPQVPFIKYRFRDRNHELDYYLDIQIKTRGLKARDNLYAMYLREQPYAKFIYDVMDGSNFHDKHDLKREKGQPRSYKKIKVENICHIVNYSILKSKCGWGITSNASLNLKAEKILQDPTGLQKAIFYANKFHEFFFNSFGDDIENKHPKFSETFFRGCLQFFMTDLRDSKIYDSRKKIIWAKLSKFKFTKSFIKQHIDSIHVDLRTMANKGVRNKAKMIL